MTNFQMKKQMIKTKKLTSLKGIWIGYTDFKL